MANGKWFIFTNQPNKNVLNNSLSIYQGEEYILSFILLSAHIQLTEFYQLLLLSSSSVFPSAAAPGLGHYVPCNYVQYLQDAALAGEPCLVV